MYAVIECINGNYSVKAEGMDEQQAKVFYFDRCKILTNASDVILGYVAIINPHLQVFGHYLEKIEHAPAPSEEVPTEEVPTEE